jgi:hypothetical protein
MRAEQLVDAALHALGHLRGRIVQEEPRRRVQEHAREGQAMLIARSVPPGPSPPT